MKESWIRPLITKTQNALKDEEEQLLTKQAQLTSELYSLSERLKAIREALSYSPPITP